MALTPGSRLGVYDITAQIGEGGMGQVYRAIDTKLKRQVAIKILPPSVSADPDRLARFQREGEVLASLNHPHIAGIYGLEEGGGGTALVMELVEGDDLSLRIAKGAIPLDEALPIAKQIAEALEAAHEQGIIHRDLKPANVKVKADGTVKVLDFGLAKAVQGDGTSARQQHPSAAMSPTMTSPAVTAMGIILGTAAYMAPEQAKGRPVDRRADIWAFGVVLYEMLTGRRAFAGDDVSDLLVSVLRDTPDFSALPADTPASVRRVLRRCLEKDPKKRLSAIGDARLDLEEVDSAPPPAAAASGPASGRNVTFAAVAALALTAIAATTAWYLKPAVALPLRLLELPASVAAGSQVVLSPDGTRVAYFLGGHLYVRALDALTSQDLGAMPATANSPFWSPDSKTLGFWADSEIRTVPAAGGAAFAVCKVPANGLAIAATWLRDGDIVFAVWRDSVYSVAAAGGTPSVAMAIDPATEIDVHHISEAPEGRLIVTIHQRSDDHMIAVLVDGPGSREKQPRVVLTDDQTIYPVDYAAPGYVVFGRTGTNAGLWAAPFNAGPIDLTRATLLQAGARAANAAYDGSLLFELPAASRVTPAWVDRAGAVSAIAGAPVISERADFALAPDGRRAAIVLGGWNAASLREDHTTLIARNLETGADTPLTFRAASGRTQALTQRIVNPSWFPSGDRILFGSGKVESLRLMVQRSDEATPASELVSGLIMGRIARDGGVLAGVDDDRGRSHLVYAPLSADGAVSAPKRVFQGDDPDVDDFDLSPDGRLVVFAARLPDRRHSIFLSEFPVGTSRWQIAEVGSRPRFSPDGLEIFYLKDGTDPRGQPTRTFMSRSVSTKPSVSLGAATELFGGSTAAAIDRVGYDVAPDGRRFLTLKSVAPAPDEGKRLVWMQNWPAAVKK